MSLPRSTEFSRVGPFLVLAVTVLILYFARELLIPFAFALTLSFLLAPAVSRLESRRVPRVLAVAITGILAFTIISALTDPESSMRTPLFILQLRSVARNRSTSQAL